MHPLGKLHLPAVQRDLRLAGDVLAHGHVLAVRVPYQFRIHRLRLHHGPEAAPEVPGFASPLLSAARQHRQEVGGHTGILVLLCKETVIQCPLYIVGVFLLPGHPVQVFRRPYHIIDRAEFLVLVPHVPTLAVGRNPEFPGVASGCGKHTPVCYRGFPEGFQPFDPLLVPGNLGNSGCAVGQRDRRVSVVVRQGVSARVQPLKQRVVFIGSCQEKILLLLCQCKQIRPYLQHACLLSAVYGCRVLFPHFLDPAHVPVRKFVQNLQGRFVPQLRVYVLQAHDGLVHRILRAPDVPSRLHHGEVLLRNASDPFAAVQFLAPGQLVHNKLNPGLQLRLLLACAQRGRRAQPVAQEMAPQLAARRFPSPVHLRLDRVVDHLSAGRNDSRLNIKVLQQASRIQLHQIIFIQFHPPRKKPGQHLDRVPFNRLQHTLFPLCFVLSQLYHIPFQMNMWIFSPYS